MYFQAEPFIREVEEAVSKGQLVRSARRLVEGLAESRAPYQRRIELLMEQVRLAQAQYDQNWLKHAAEVAQVKGFKNYQWICDNIHRLSPRRSHPGSQRTQEISLINERYTTEPVRNFRLQVNPSLQRQVSDAQGDESPSITPEVEREQSWVSDAQEDKSSAINQEEEERLLALSPDVSIHAEDGESDSVLFSSLLSMPEEPALVLEDKGAWPKAYTSTTLREDCQRRSTSSEEWKLVSGRQKLFRIPVDDHQQPSTPTPKSERRSPSGTRSDHTDPQRGRDSRTSSEPKRGRRSPSGSSQRKKSCHRRESSSNRLSDRSRWNYSMLKAQHHPDETQRRRTEKTPRKSRSETMTRHQREPRSEMVTRPQREPLSSVEDVTSTSRRVQISRGHGLRIYVKPLPASGYQPEGHQVQNFQIVPEAFDANCHYFLMLLEFGLFRNVEPAVAFTGATPGPGYEVNVTSALLMFSDPFLYPSENEMQQLRPRGFSLALGVKPKMAVTEAQLDTLARLMSESEVAALGEIGVDHTVDCSSWPRQTSDTVRLVRCLPRQQNKVLIIKCRGMKDRSSSEAYDVLCASLHTEVSPDQLIHLTCFTGDSQVVEKWLRSFPMTYFGFTRTVDSFNEDQKEALRRIEDARILLETYSPYIKFGSRKPSTPAQIGMTAAAVADIRGGTWESVLALATRNAWRLYQERKEPDCDWSGSHRTYFR